MFKRLLNFLSALLATAKSSFALQSVLLVGPVAVSSMVFFKDSAPAPVEVVVHSQSGVTDTTGSGFGDANNQAQNQNPPWLNQLIQEPHKQAVAETQKATTQLAAIVTPRPATPVAQPQAIPAAAIATATSGASAGPNGGSGNANTGNTAINDSPPAARDVASTDTPTTSTSNTVANNIISTLQSLLSSGDASSTTTSTSSSASSSSSGAAGPSHTPTLTQATNLVYPLDGSNDTIVQGTKTTLTVSATDPDGDTVSLSTCTYETPDMSASDPNYVASATNCTSLPSLITSNGVLVLSTTSVDTVARTITWVPTSTQRGTYKFNVIGTDGTNTSSTMSFYVTVREPFYTSNLLSGLEGFVSSTGTGIGGSIAAGPRVDASSRDTTSTAWYDIMGTWSGTISGFGTSAPWTGTGATSSPYRLSFNGTSDAMDLSTVLSGKTKMLFSTWVNPSSAASLDKVIASNGGGTSSGFVVKQSAADAGKIDFQVGQPSYSNLIISERPAIYYRLDDSGNTATDSSGNGNNGNQTGVTKNISGLLANDSNTAITATATGIEANNAITATTGYSCEAWVYMTGTTNNRSICAIGAQWAPAGGFLWLTALAGVATLSLNFYDGVGAVWDTSTVTLSLSTIHHIVLTTDFTGYKLYLNGSLAYTYTGTIGTLSAPLYRQNFGTYAYNSHNWNQGTLDEAAAYTYALSPQQVKNHYDAGKNYKFPANAIMAKGPVSYWRLNETSGTTATDAAVSGANGTYTGTANSHYYQGVKGALSDDADTAVEFDGANGCISNIGTTSTYKFLHQTGIFTISFWAKLTNYTDVTYGATEVLNNEGAGGAANGFTIAWNTGVRKYYMILNRTDNFIPTATVTDNNWHHIAFVGTGSTVRMFQDGVYSNNSAIATLTAGNALNVLTMATRSDSVPGIPYKGRLDEVALFSRSLSDAEVAALYANSTYYQCRSSIALSNSAWYNLSSLWDGTNASLYINGRKECSVTPSTTFASTTNFTMGSTPTSTGYWAGDVADVKLYGTGGAAVATATDIKTNFSTTANRFRSTPVEDIVTNGLVLHLDAANAKRGVSAFTNGCASSDLNWFDLSGTGTATPLLVNFSGCGASRGWNGNGTAANPYRLTIDASAGNNYVDMQSTGLIGASNTFTISTWMRPLNFIGSVATIYSESPGAYAHVRHYFAYTDPANGQQFLFDQWTPNAGSLNSSTLVTLNQWTHMVYTQNGSNRALYINGVLDAFDSSAEVYSGSTPTIAQIGRRYNGDALNADIATLSIYNRSLSYAEVLQNCNAQVARFQGASCASATNPITSIGAMALWLRADTGVTKDVNNKVSSWADQSGNSFNATQSTASAQPTYVSSAINSLPALRFDGSASYLTNSSLNSLNGATNYTLFIVGTLNATTGSYYALDAQVSKAALQINSNNALFHATTGNYGQSAFASTATTVFSSIYDGSQAGNATRLLSYVNGTSQALAFTGAIPASVAGTSGFNVGRAYGTSSGFWNGDIAEIIIYTGALTSTQRSKVECWLGTKYGITVTGCTQ